MDLSNLRTKIERLPVNAIGRRIYPAEIRNEMVQASRVSSLSRSEFCEQLGIHPSLIYKLLKGSGCKKGKSKFRKVQIISETKEYRVYGPGGMQVVCGDVNQVAQLWRALC